MTTATTEEQVMEATPTKTTPELRLADRCDRCGAQAFVVTEHDLPDGRSVELLFCGHHYAKHEEHLAPHLALDARDRINERGTAAY